MNKKIRRFLSERISPKAEIIKKRSDALDWVLNVNIPFYFKNRAEDIITMYMLGMDTLLMKVIPILVEDILISIAVSYHARYREEIGKLQKKYESKYGHEILEELYRDKIISEEDYRFCKHYYSDEGNKLRNLEIHNKELKKLDSKHIILRDEVTGEEIEADQIIVDMIKSAPWLTRSINDNHIIKQIQVEVIGILNLLINNSSQINLSDNLYNKDTLEFVNKQVKQKDYLITTKKKVDMKTFEQFIISNIRIDSYKFENVEDLTHIYIKFKEDTPNLECSMLFLPVLGGEFTCKPV